MIGALLSRAAVYVLQPLSRDELETLLDRALAVEPERLTVEAAAREMMFDLADGDARRLLNALEVVGNAARDRNLSSISADFLRDSLPATLRRFDKGGENFYDQVSALHKSVRGSDPDASLYWMVRMFDGGVDPRYVARRAIRMAAEDIGLADPRGSKSHWLLPTPTSGSARRRANSHSRRRSSISRVRRSPTRSIARTARRVHLSNRMAHGRYRCTCATHRRG